MNDDADDSRFVRSIDRALDAIELLQRRAEPMTLHALSNAFEWPKSTTLKILRTLVRRGVIGFDSHHKTYQVARGAAMFPAPVPEQLVITPEISARMQQLARETGEVTTVIIALEHETVIRELVRAPQTIQYNASVGERRPLHCTSPGKLALSFRTAAQLEAYLSGPQFRPFSPRTIADPAVLRKEIRKIQSSGFAISDGEFELDLFGASAPIRRGASGTFAAALTVAGPTLRMRSKIDDILPVLCRAAGELTDALA